MATAQPDPRVAAAIAAAYRQQTTATRSQLTEYIAAVWASLGTYRNPQIKPFLSQVVPAVIGAEKHMVSLTSAYLATSRQAAVGGPSTPLALPSARYSGDATRNGVTPEEVYERPFHVVWRELGAGTAPDVAITRGLRNAQKSATTDVQRAKVLATHDAVEQDERVTWTERMLEGTQSCGLCIVASTQRYTAKTLLPIHPGCDCSVVTHYGEPDDEPLHLGRLADVHAAIESTFGKSSSAARTIPDLYLAGKPVKYRDVLIVHEHGEIGPVLAVKGQHFTGPSDLAA